MNKLVVGVYEGDKSLGNVDVYVNPHLVHHHLREIMKERLRIMHFSTPSERCPPLAVLHSITSQPTGLCCKLVESVKSPNSPLSLMHSSCLRENKTAVVSLGREELHLVAMRSRTNGACPCFWGFNVAPGLYESCLVMLNLRCLGIVFDLDETLIVANTLRSFDDRMEALQRKINIEADPQRIAGMLAEVKRYQDDKSLLKQYVESDQIVDNGKVIKSQSEVVPALSDNHPPLIRPLIRLQEKNIILTRINPLIRDTSVLVRLRPAWEDLRSYLTARGRKRFEVYVCTMAERDYALEMWRLLDPDSNLINTKELLNRIVCVKSGLRKSLFNVFQYGNCHPKMALVIDDRLKVWDERDQPRVHVVPAFAPYYAPQAEANNAVPILCVARNVACNVRGGFFKDFDDGLLQRIAEVVYEDDIKEVGIVPPDVSNYLISEDDASGMHSNKEALAFDGMADTEVERRLKEAIPPSIPIDPRLSAASQYIAPVSIPVVQPTAPGPLVQFSGRQLPQAPPVLQPLTQAHPEVSLRSSPAREEGEVPESELDPDTRRRLLILQHGMDMRDQLTEPRFPVRPPQQVAVPRVQPGGGWYPVEEEMSPRQLNVVGPPKEFQLRTESMLIDKHHPVHPPFLPKLEAPISSDRVLVESQRLPKEALQRDDRLMRPNNALPNYPSFPGDEGSLGQSSSSNRGMDFDAGKHDAYPESPTEYLHEIAAKCGTRVEFRHTLVPSTELQFCVEVWFAGEKIGGGIGRTRREAQHQAAEGSLMNLADKYLSRLKPGTGPNANSNGFISDENTFGHQPFLREESIAFPAPAEPARVVDSRMEGSKKGSISALKDLCMMEGWGMTFQHIPELGPNQGPNAGVCAQVEIEGEVWGKGIGLTWDDAKMQAAEKALTSLKARTGQYPQKRQASPRSFHGMPNKRFRPEYPRVLQRMPSSGRYPKNAASPVP